MAGVDTSANRPIRFPNTTGLIDYITPQSRVWFLKGTGLDNSYRHTYGHMNQPVNTQFNFFVDNFGSIELTNCIPIREESAIRVPRNANDLYDCDYLIYRNINYNARNYYAFITKVEWVNTEVCKVYFEIDVMQTWYRYLIPKYVFMERCHAEVDVAGDNTIPENVELGPYVAYDTSDIKTGLFDDYWIIVASTVDKSGNAVVGNMYGGIYSGITYLNFSSYSEANAFINTITTQNKSNAIVSIFMYPKSFFLAAGGWMPQVYWSHKFDNNNLNGYIPINQKLFTYPYIYLLCSNYSGGAATYRYEYFGGINTTYNFILYMDITPNPTAMCVPRYYKGQNPNWNEKLTMEGFPQCAWQVDTYKAWLAQNGSQMAVHNLGTAFGALGSLLSGNIGGAISGGFSIAESVAKVNATQTLPPQAYGSSGSSSLLAFAEKDFHFCRMGISYEYAKIIDNYFTMFGYAQKKVMLLKTGLRKSYNYIETKECTFDNNGAPQEALRKICDIFNHGVTIWHGNWLGDYTRDNSPGPAG